MEENNFGQEDQSIVRTPQPIEQINNRNYSQDLRAQTQQYRQQAVEGFNKAKDRATEYWGQANDKLKDLQNKDLNQIAEDAKDYARRKPGQALMISAAAGLLIGMILRRRR